MNVVTGGGSARSAMISALNRLSSAAEGLWPSSRRNATSSNVAFGEVVDLVPAIDQPALIDRADLRLPRNHPF